MGVTAGDMVVGGGAPAMGAEPGSESPVRDEYRDLGFGSVVANQAGARMLNRDGSFNVERRGLGVLARLNAYHWLLSMSWGRFLLLVAATYLVMNVMFAAAYYVLGAGALVGADPSLGDGMLRAFFFSVQTFATIGYGHIAPNGVAANVLVTVESLVGLMAFALATGLLYGRFSRPFADIAYSERAVVAPYRGITGLMFRVANRRSNELTEVHAKVMLSWKPAGATGRRFHELDLERQTLALFPLSWTVVHPIDASSPLHGVDRQAFLSSDAEIYILLSATDETFSSVVHSRSSYTAPEVVFAAKFVDAFERDERGGIVAVDVSRLSEIEPAALS